MSTSSHPGNTKINSFQTHPLATKYSLTVSASNVIIKYFTIKITLESL